MAIPTDSIRVLTNRDGSAHEFTANVALCFLRPPPPAVIDQAGRIRLRQAARQFIDKLNLGPKPGSTIQLFDVELRHIESEHTEIRTNPVTGQPHWHVTARAIGIALITCS